jgi:hypothetical protein
VRQVTVPEDLLRIALQEHLVEQLLLGEGGGEVGEPDARGLVETAEVIRLERRDELPKRLIVRGLVRDPQDVSHQ